MGRKKGFTLVELLFVVAIIGIVMSLLAPALLTVKRRARALQCVSHLRQFAILNETYSASNNSIIPYINTGPEGRKQLHRLYNPATRVPSLKYFCMKLGAPGELAMCPSDNGCSDQSFFPTHPGNSCFDEWGQSMLYNASCYVEVGAPGYGKGPLYGARPVVRMSVTRESEFMIASDFWPHWHFGARGGDTCHYFTNVLFFDGHVEGRHYETQKQGLAYLNWDGLRRWWVEKPAPPTE